MATTYTACIALPARRLIHRDGPCRCFFGGPAPEYAPALLPGQADPDTYAPHIR